MQRNSGKTLKNNLCVNQNQLHTIIQIIIVAGKCFAETQAIIASILSKINIWQDSNYLDISKHNYHCKITFWGLFLFFSHSIFFFLLKRKSLLHCYKVNVTKVTLLIRFELIGAHSHSTYANMSNILTSRPPLVCMYTFYRPPSPIPLFHRIFLSFWIQLSK